MAVVPKLPQFEQIIARHERRIRRLEIAGNLLKVGVACYALNTHITTTAASWTVDCSDMSPADDVIDTIGLTLGTDIEVPIGWTWDADIIAGVGFSEPPLGEAIYWTATVNTAPVSVATVPVFDASAWPGFVGLHVSAASGDENPSTLAFTALETMLGTEFTYASLFVCMTGYRAWAGVVPGSDSGPT